MAFYARMFVATALFLLGLVAIVVPLLVCISHMIKLNSSKAEHIKCIDEIMFTHGRESAIEGNLASFLEIAKKRIQTYDETETLFGLTINATMARSIFGFISTAIVGVLVGTVGG